ncbi:hypothetical protein [Clostridium sp.]|uniref:hypothetical protein n=1 Tax=Clostridium sp. TaxID=1506 RepID=UPI002840203B|nr:hypothetical protein [Clostridium sp.]MDR3597421.1 hypothetical protein [Clostridium sp.]
MNTFKKSSYAAIRNFSAYKNIPWHFGLVIFFHVPNFEVRLILTLLISITINAAVVQDIPHA